jgi:hypothetical protein
VRRSVILALSDLEVPPGARYLVAGILFLSLLWWTGERMMGDSDDPSVNLGGDWLLFRASGHVLVALVAGVIGLALAPEIIANESARFVPVVLLGIVVLWIGYKRAEGSNA